MKNDRTLEQQDVYSILLWMKNTNLIVEGKDDFALKLMSYFDRNKKWSDKQMSCAKDIVSKKFKNDEST